MSSLPIGVFAGQVDCVVEVERPDGQTGEEPFSTELTVAIFEDNSMTINGEPVEVGATHVRSLPFADMGFEIVQVDRSIGTVRIMYEPRPTLPGITATGQLVETYVSSEDNISVSAEADLTLNDVDGATQLQIDCAETQLDDVP